MTNDTPYTLREVDGCDGSRAFDLEHLHALTFAREAPPIDTEQGWWWLVTFNQAPVAFAGLLDSDRFKRFGYVCRVGVAHAHRGCRLQVRLLKAMERKARAIGMIGLVSDCTNDNPASANSFIRAGWQIFWPEPQWAFPKSIYWRKRFHPCDE